MAVTLAKLKAAVIVKMGEVADDGMLENLVDTINAGLQEMATDYDWSWLIRRTTFETVNGLADYDTPARATRIRTLSIGSSPLVGKQWEELLDYDGISSSPQYYGVENDTITLAPTPNSAVTVAVRYVIAENELVDDDDEAFVPDWYSDFAAVYCAIKEAERRRDTVLVGLYEASRQRWMKRIQDNISRTKDVPLIRVRPDAY